MKKTILLSIDGGGIRGIIPVTILSYLEKRIQNISGNKNIHLSNLVDFVAGTSTGSVIGSLMLIPENLPCDRMKNELSIERCIPKYSLEDILQIYFEFGNDVLKTSFKHNVKTLWGILGPRYPQRNIEKPLIELLNYYKLKDLIKPCMFTGYDIDNRRAHLYTNLDKNKQYEDFYVKDVVNSSIAVPSYFPPANFRTNEGIQTTVDGGVFASNPTMCAYVEASKTIFNEKLEEKDPNNMIIISLGTGSSMHKSYTYKKAKRWGKAQWLLPIIDILLTSGAEIVDYQMQRIYNAYGKSENYIRLNPPLENASKKFDDASKENMMALLKDTYNWKRKNKQTLDDIANIICDNNIII